MIEAKNVEYKYTVKDDTGNTVSAVKALDGVNIEISDGEFVAVIGSNGSGKSTFAKHLNSLLRPTGGSVYVNGKDTAEPANEFFIRSTTGMVFQNPDNQFVANVVEEDVGFGPENLAVAVDEIERRVEESLKAVDMNLFRISSPNHLSGGQKQRISIAGILAMHPKCIILDEPTAMLDPQGRKRVIKLLKDINKREGITIILITHYMEEVVDVDKIYVMKKGRVADYGTPEKIFSNTQLLQECNLEVPAISQLINLLRMQGIPVSKGVLKEEQLINELASFAGVSERSKNVNTIERGKLSV